MIRLLGRINSSNVQKVAWLLAELGIAHERRDVGGTFGGNREADYLRRNPTGLIPTLIDGDVAVWESNTILRYLCRTHGPTALYPADAAARAQVEAWMDWQLSALGAPMSALFFGLVRTAPDARDPKAIEQHRARCAELFTLLDGALGQRATVCGDTMTLADIAIGPLVYRWFELPVTRPALPALERWYASMRQRPAFAEFVMVGLT